jgi:hypothetical protein
MKPRLYTPKGPLPEVMIWRIFRCLALGLAMVENGNEELDGASWDREIVHFNIKPENSEHLILSRDDWI